MNNPRRRHHPDDVQGKTSPDHPADDHEVAMAMLLLAGEILVTKNPEQVIKANATDGRSRREIAALVAVAEDYVDEMSPDWRDAPLAIRKSFQALVRDQVRLMATEGWDIEQAHSLACLRAVDASKRDRRTRSKQRNPRSKPQEKTTWEGTIVGVQVRSKVGRYRTDNRTHTCTGYNLLLRGSSPALPRKRTFMVAISENQQQKHGFRIGDQVMGTAWTKKTKHADAADLSRAGGFKTLGRAARLAPSDPPPWRDDPPPLAVYQSRGARMLCSKQWGGVCRSCKWATKAAVTIWWDFDTKTDRHRFETFCYGPKDCEHYLPGPPRAVPYKDRPDAMDTGFLDDLLTAGRSEENRNEKNGAENVIQGPWS